jgi:hypothetical protein
MLKEEDKAYEKRHSLCVKFRDMNLPYSIRIELTKSMDGQTEIIKEKIAEQLLQIISESKTEKEMLEKASQIRI